jgi:hypothetical protein
MVMDRCIGIMDLFIRESGYKACNMAKAKYGKIIELCKREYSKMVN